MSNFLEKLKSGGVVVDNNAPPDKSGVVVRRVEKYYASQPADELGLSLSADAEVLGVAPNSLAAAANIPVNYMIYDVNDEFIETAAQFAEAASRNLRLTIRLQSVAAMSELIARILRDEEQRMNDESRPQLNLEELCATTPRYNFLSSAHPLFGRYTRRLRQKREATALIKQRMQEVEEQQRRELRERIQREQEQAAKEAAAAIAEEQEEKKKADVPFSNLASEQAEAVVDDAEEEQPFVPVADDTSAFAGFPAAPQPHDDIAASESAPDNVTADELRALIGLPTAMPPAPPRPPVLPTMPPVVKEEVRYVMLPSEEYVLQSGERVVAALKLRTGPLPSPPEGKPPRPPRPPKVVEEAKVEVKAVKAVDEVRKEVKPANVAEQLRRVERKRDFSPLQEHRDRRHHDERRRSRERSSSSRRHRRRRTSSSSRRHSRHRHHDGDDNERRRSSSHHHRSSHRDDRHRGSSRSRHDDSERRHRHSSSHHHRDVRRRYDY